MQFLIKKKFMFDPGDSFWKPKIELITEVVGFLLLKPYKTSKT